MTGMLTPEHFLPHVGKTFHVDGGGHSLTLARIDRRRREDWEHEVGLREPFNLIFRGLADELLGAGMYRLQVEDGPRFDLYVMPIHTPGRNRQDYQASFN